MNRLPTPSPLAPTPLPPHTSWSRYRALWKPESWASGSVFKLKESELPLTTGIQSPSFTNKESWIQYLEPGIHNVKSTILNCMGSIVETRVIATFKI